MYVNDYADVKDDDDDDYDDGDDDDDDDDDDGDDDDGDSDSTCKINTYESRDQRCLCVMTTTSRIITMTYSVVSRHWPGKQNNNRKFTIYILGGTQWLRRSGLEN